jgi:hypothetical protein
MWVLIHPFSLAMSPRKSLVHTKSHACSTPFTTSACRADSLCNLAVPDQLGAAMPDVVAFAQQWEWVLLGLITILEVTILVQAVRESRERHHLVREMQSTRVELGRESYVAMKRDALLDAKRHVSFVSRTLNADLGLLGDRDFERLYRPGVRYRCITGNDPTRLREMFDLHRRGVEVRLNPLVVVSTFRFHVWDDKGAILGFSAEAEEHEIRGIEAMNSYFSRVLHQHFDQMWEQSVPWQEWAGTFVFDAKGTEAENPVEELAEQWSLSDDATGELRELLGEVKVGV